MLRARVYRFGFALLAVAMLAFSFSFLTSSASADNGRTGNVYTETNATSGNSILVFERSADGTLSAATSIPTGGLGTGANLGSQGALALEESRQWLFAVNGGSNDISVIHLNDGTVASRVSSGGIMPISITVSDGWVYVLNAGGAGNISGFAWDHQGNLTPISGSTRPLGGAGPAEIKFNPDGNVLVVTEKATSTIDTYTVADGIASGPVSHPSSGQTPFGFDFGHRNTLVVSEATVSAASSYRVSGDGAVNVVSPSVAGPGQKAACWLVVTGNGRFAYTANAGSGTITGYAVAPNGSVALLDANGITGTTGGHPIDEALSRNSKFLYVLNTGAGVLGINAFAVQSDGSLTSLPSTGGTPASAVGLVAR
jgi:6-phosphogluconolactonase (cycloisomerase 2 family)